MVIFYQNNSEGSFDDSLREPEQLPQRVFCVVTVWDTPLTSIEFHFPQICPPANLTRVSKYFLPAFSNFWPQHLNMIFQWKWPGFIEISFGLFPGGVRSDLEKVAIMANLSVLFFPD